MSFGKSNIFALKIILHKVFEDDLEERLGSVYFLQSFPSDQPLRYAGWAPVA